jgi:hypothetical protein
LLKQKFVEFEYENNIPKTINGKIIVLIWPNTYWDFLFYLKFYNIIFM